MTIKSFAMIGLAILLTATGVGSAVSFHARSKNAAKPITYSSRLQVESFRRTTGGPQALLDSVVRGMGSSLIADAVIGGPPKGFQPTDDPGTAPPQDFTNGVWANIKVHVPTIDPSPSWIKPLWEARLAVGAERDLLHANGLPPLYSDSLSVIKPDGRIDDAGGGIGDIAFGQVFEKLSRPAIEQRISAGASAAGLKLISVDFVHGLEDAPIVIAEDDDPTGFVANHDARIDALLGGSARDFEGEYVEIRDASGAPFFIQASAFRVGVGQQWIRPDLDPRHGMLAPAVAG